MPSGASAGGAVGIWRFAERFERAVPVRARISLGEGDTPCQEHVALAREVGLERLWLKREDLNPTGSHKDRGAAFQVSARVADMLASGHAGGTLVISSSGNAAVAAAAYVARTPFHLVAFVAPGTPDARVARILEAGADVIVSEQAISLCDAYARSHALANLRPSTDPLAVFGFMSLGWELLEAGTSADSVFAFASSGTSLVAIGRAVEEGLDGSSKGGRTGAWPFGLHVVQGTYAHPIAGRFDPRPVPAGEGAGDGEGKTGAHGARKTRRLGEAVRLVTRSGGSGWIVTDDEAEDGRRRLSAAGIDVSIESGAALAAAQRAAAEGRVKRAIVVLTGASRREEGRMSVDGPTGRLLRAETLDDLDPALGSAP